MLGAERESNTINLTDTAELVAYVFNPDETAALPADLSAVNFTIKKPDETRTTVTGTIQSDGSGFLRYTDTDQVGLYVWVAQFVFASGEKRTYRDEFRVNDPLETPPITRSTEIAEQVWLRLEDCFDSETGGPWLRDMTLSWFEPSKIEQFVPEGLLLINMWPPHSNIDLSFFTTREPNSDPALPAGSTQPDSDRIVLVQATLLATIKHLMRSYVEQPQPMGANIVWQSKRDYLERWNTIYQIEEAYFKEMLALWKRQFMNYGHGSLLIGTKAGRLVGTNMRTRNIARGWW
jgi:hypothetical protein